MKFFLLLFLAITLSAQSISRTQVIMSTLVSITVDEKEIDTLFKAFDVVRDVDKTLSSYKENSIISKLNRDKKVKLDTLSYEALSLSLEYYKNSDGYFNILIGSITKDLYKFGEEEHVPSKSSLDKAKIDIELVEFDTSEAKLLEYDAKVDLGGMGKGFALDKLNNYLYKQGVKNAIMSASGDIRCQKQCLISVQNPFRKGMMLSFVTTKQNLGITTSGNYNRYVKDKTHNHLINPKTKHSQQNFASITLVGDIKSSALDAYATAISVMPKSKAYCFLDRLGVGYVVVEVNKKTLIKPAGFFELR